MLATSIEHKEVNVLLTDAGDDLTIEIEDNGAGIAEDAADRLFEVGFSTKQEHNRGFGLALVKQALQQLGGHISFQTGSEGGTQFTVVIPKERRDSY